MTDQNLKKDAGKPRMDLVPWDGFETRPDSVSVGAMFGALQSWWVTHPRKLGFQVPERVLPGVAAVLGFGAAKYAPRGWERGIPYSRVFAAACRHALAYQAGELLDPESGLPHEAHFWCNVVFLLTFEARGVPGLDDRPVYPEEPARG